jgi:hypothetical protein
MIEFGLAKVCITPPPGIRLFGQPEQLEAVGKYTDLYARSLYLHFGENDIMLITCDILFLPKENMDYMREEISKNTGIDFRNIIIHTTHTHAGPSLISLFNEDNVDAEASSAIFKGIIDSGVTSFNNKRRGFVFFGRDVRKDLAFNRRYIMKDGSVELHPHKDNPDLIGPEGPADPEINVLLIKDENGVPAGAVANFSCHLTTLERNNTKYSADFPFFAEKNLMKSLENDEFVLLYFNGPCGNVCQVNVENKDSVEVGIEHTKNMGERFSQSVINAMESAVPVGGKVFDDDAFIKTLYKEIKVPVRKITENMVSTAKNTLNIFDGKYLGVSNVSNYGIESYDDKSVISANQFLETDFWKKAAASELLTLHERYKNDNLETVPLTVANIDGIFIATVPAELFVEYSLEIKSKLKEKYRGVIVIELANGWVGYVPTKRAFIPEKGGYEVQFLNSSKLCEEAGDIMVKEIFAMEKELGRA